MPSTFLKLLMQSINKILILRALRFLLGQVINIITLPLILIYLIIYLRTKNLDAIFCHNGGRPGGV